MHTVESQHFLDEVVLVSGHLLSPAPDPDPDPAPAPAPAPDPVQPSGGLVPDVFKILHCCLL